jgi:hypothetical protein
MATKKPTAQLGVWIDETVPDLSVVLKGIADPRDLADWLGPKLGQLRFHTAMKRPSADDEREALASFRSALIELRRLLAPDGLPAYPAARLKAIVLLRGGLQWHDEVSKLTNTLDVLEFATAMTEREWAGLSSKTGRPSAAARDKLLTETAEWLLPACHGKQGAARQVARQVLQACGLAFPTGTVKDPDSTVNKAARRGKNSR